MSDVTLPFRLYRGLEAWIQSSVIKITVNNSISYVQLLSNDNNLII